jgi:hypothetical protein
MPVSIAATIVPSPEERLGAVRETTRRSKGRFSLEFQVEKAFLF